MKKELMDLHSKVSGFADPFLESVELWSARDAGIGIIIGFIAAVLMVSQSTEALINGDAATYLQQMRDLSFSIRPVHIGYYLAGAAFIRIVPLADEQAINLMNSLFGAVSVVMVYFITLAVCHKRLGAIASACLLLTNYIFIENSIYAEVYTPQVCFSLMAFLLWLFNRPLFAGLAFAIAVLITPGAALSLPVFIILRPKLKPLIKLAAVVVIICAVAIAPVHKTYVFGSRGLLNASGTPVDFVQALTKEAHEIYIGVFAAIGLSVAGFAIMLGRASLRPLAIGVIAVWASNLVFGEKFRDVPVQLTTYALLCIVSGVAVQYLTERLRDKRFYHLISAIFIAAVAATLALKRSDDYAGLVPQWILGFFVVCGLAALAALLANRLGSVGRAIAVLCVIIAILVPNAVNTYGRVKALNRDNLALREAVLRMKEVGEPGFVFLAGWNGILYEHYLFGRSYTSAWIDVMSLAGFKSEARREEASEKLAQSIALGRQIWLEQEDPKFIAFLKNSGYSVKPFMCFHVATMETKPPQE